MKKAISLLVQERCHIGWNRERRSLPLPSKSLREELGLLRKKDTHKSARFCTATQRRIEFRNSILFDLSWIIPCLESFSRELRNFPPAG
jgi:hypothetical protein